MTDSIQPQKSNPKGKSWPAWVYLLILISILTAGAYLRLVGIDWDENQHLHPDERFLTMVESALKLSNTPPDQLGTPPSVANQPWRADYVGVLPDCGEWGPYFDTACSPLNPNNQGYDFYVYGTLPIFIVRYAAEWLGQSGYGEVYLVGRALSALSDLFVIILVYAIAALLYDRRVAVLAAAFSACSVLLIQQSHFFTVDTFTNLFIFLAIYFAVRVTVARPPSVSGSQPFTHHGLPDSDPEIDLKPKAPSYRRIVNSLLSHPIFWPSIFFGVGLGMAVASKINAAPLALTLPGAALVYLLRLSSRERDRQILPVFLFLVLAGFVSVVAFRVFQPYAFSGPGFLGIKPNPAWIDDLRSLRAQTGGDVDFPPALQWARRPLWFSLQNLVLWGLGLPLGGLSWAGFLWMGWRNFKGEWKQHGLLWSWTAVYFIWQSLQWNSTLRYQLPIYPLLAIFGAWLLFHLWDKAKLTARKPGVRNRVTPFVYRVLILTLGAGVLIATATWAFSFSRIYTRPHTRVEATRWLFQNMPATVNLSIQTEDGLYNQPLSFPQDFNISAGSPYTLRFTAQAEGQLRAIQFPYIVDQLGSEAVSVVMMVSSLSDQSTLIRETIAPQEIKNGAGESYAYSLTEPVVLNQGEAFSLDLNVGDGYGVFEVCGPLTLNFLTVDGLSQQELALMPGCLPRSGLPYAFEFVADVDGILQDVVMTIRVEEPEPVPTISTLALALTSASGDPLYSGELTSEFETLDDPRGASYAFPVGENVPLEKDQVYILDFSLVSGNGVLSISSFAPVNESSWDDGLPLRMDGYDPYGGIYPGGLNFEMYWDDNQEKYDRFVSNLDQSDYILISSSRQWGSTTRVPERYPLTTEYYRRLAGCPDDQAIEWCYNVAQPGMFRGDLGFELVKVFQSNPTLGNFEINDQFAEEAFTVYDHPKVLIFKKIEDYDPDRVRDILGAVDLSKVIRITPKQADSTPGNLLLPSDRLEKQNSGGTWSEYFNPQAFQNRFQVFGVLLWYLSVSLVGWMVYPLLRYALPGLADRGYPLARTTGLLLLSTLVWLAGSAQIPFQRPTIAAGLLVMLLLGGWLGYRQRDSLRQEWKERRPYFIKVEALFLAFFLAGLLIRFGNPDLWHSWKGGEKPMDFSYLNAVLKSTSFPPYDPWFAGGYINYYYYGFVFVGVLVKFLGIVPSFAYNLILATLLSLIAMGAFSIVWNLLAGREPQNVNRKSAFFPALSGALGMAVIGNLGILQMFARGLQVNAAPGGNIEGAGLAAKFIWTISGFIKTITGTPLPIRADEWYWNPSRVIAYQHGSPITEFPFFTFLYADLHAHLIALPVALLVVTWVVSVVRGRAWERPGSRDWTQVGLGMLLGGLAIGSLYPINLSDIYTYLPLGALALMYAAWRYGGSHRVLAAHPWISDFSKRLGMMVVSVLGLYALTQIIFQPYMNWYGQGYSEIKIWEGTHTPLSDYLVHWGFFLFILVSWMFYESIDWMANTPVSALLKLKPYRGLILVGLGTLFTLILVLGVDLYPDGLPPDRFPVGLGIHVAWVVLPLVAWAGVLLFRSDLSDAKRLVLFFIGTGLVLTVMVELVVVSGDIGRMNTVFKFYLHAWLLFAVGSGAAFGWLVNSFSGWSYQGRNVWQVAFSILAFSTVLYPLLGSTAKIMDRMESTAPHTLDGMAYMRYATYHDEGVAMDLSQDYNAIRWMQDYIAGSPVIVEANSVEYHWGTRYTIYTGNPGVVGWNWHQRQQRTITPHDWVFERVDAVHEFYQTEDLQWTQDFLKKYGVQYIVFGQLEQAKYAGPGLAKFAVQEGVLWHEVFRDRDTVLYEVIPEVLNSK